MSQAINAAGFGPSRAVFRVKVTTWSDASAVAIGGKKEVEIVIEGGSGTFSGFIPKAGLFSSGDKPITKRIPLAEIVDVTMLDKVVSFDLYQAGRLYSRCSLLAASESEALRLASLLPAVVMQEFADEHQKGQTFAQELAADTPTTWVFPTIIALNVIAFIITGLRGGGWVDSNPEKMLEMGADFAPYTTSGQWWRLMTSSFLHFGVIHLLANMYALLFVGQIAERLFGNTIFAVIYLLSALLSGLASVWFEPLSISAGASGAIFALYGAVIAFVVMQKGSFPKAAAKAVMQSALVFVGYNVLYGFSAKGISNAAHLGGLVSGLVLGAVMSRPVIREKRRAQFPLKLGAGLGFGIGAIILVVGLIPKSGIDPQSEEAFDTARVEVVNKEQKFAMTRIKELAKQYDGHPEKNAEFAGKLRSEIVPAWDRAFNAVKAAEVTAKSPTRGLWELFVEYTRARRDGYKAWAEFFETDNQDKETEFEALMKKGNAAVEKINAILEKH